MPMRTREQVLVNVRGRSAVTAEIMLKPFPFPNNSWPTQREILAAVVEGMIGAAIVLIGPVDTYEAVQQVLDRAIGDHFVATRPRPPKEPSDGR